MRTTKQIQNEVAYLLGFVPPFFAPAEEIPSVPEGLRQQTRSAYLSRYCLAPYLLVCHSRMDRQVTHLSRRVDDLGLVALVKRLVEPHCGRVRAHGAGLGQGVEFFFRLPAQSLAAGVEPAGGPAPPGEGRRRVLVIEDNLDAAESMRMLLTTTGFDVAVAHTGTAGVAEARRFRPDVVLCDIGLPELDGYGVARALRLEPGTARTRLIAVTGYGRDEDRRRAREAGFDLHLTKPVEPEELLRVAAGDTAA